MNWTILESKHGITFAEINALTESVGWGRAFHQTESKWQNVLEKSSHVAYVRDGGNVIAFGRILEDGIMCMFYDICVHPDYQNKMVGKSLMHHLIDKIKDKAYVSIGLFVWEGNQSASEFYGKLGFKSVNAMELKEYMVTFC